MKNVCIVCGGPGVFVAGNVLVCSRHVVFCWACGMANVKDKERLRCWHCGERFSNRNPN